MTDTRAAQHLRACIGKVATGPDYSKDLDFDEAYAAMQHILSGKADPVQAGIYLIALRMKRETDTENLATLKAIQDNMTPLSVALDQLVDIADAYDGWVRGTNISAFVAPLLAACGLPALCSGVVSVGPKHGVNQHKQLKAAGIDVLMRPAQVKAALENPACGWAYLDQSVSCPALNALLPLREQMVKRPLLTTLETLTRPVQAGRTHLWTGYVHKAYPPVYSTLAMAAGYDSALVVRGVEGGVLPSLQQSASTYRTFRDAGAMQHGESDPHALGLNHSRRCLPLPDGLARRDDGDTPVMDALAAAAADAALAALQGAPGAARDSLIYGAALALWHCGVSASLEQAAADAAKALDDGSAYQRFCALRDSH
ncbi:anthranilate phosphoribosyltransferase [Granulosicoccaceae sp. 1_MG-2023]|nr:anthranilate phosphoribosyltransferase [Granulosicoccaceae sp. 1_MG-2023]